MTRRPIRATVAALLLTAAVAGCGGTDEEDTGSSSSGAATTERPAPPAGGERPSQEAIEGFAACLRRNGVDVPDEAPAQGGTPPFDPQDPAVQQAFQACQDQLPEGALPGGAPPEQR